MTSAEQPAPLAEFLDHVRQVRREFVSPADIVLETMPFMHRFVQRAAEMLREEHLKPAADHYARNLVHAEEDGSMSLYCLVWTPGQWTPVHDHGAWGLVGVVRGALQERAFIRTDPMEREDNGIILRRGGTCVLSPGSVTTFVANPDHIHRAGVPRNADPTVTLHLYGRNMDRYNIYDLELGRRVPVEVAADNDIL